MAQTYDMHKAAGVIIQDHKLLVTREKGKDVFIAPGGKLQAGETSQAAVARELNEELNITVKEDNLKVMDTFYAEAATSPGKLLRMDVYEVTIWEGELVPSAEIEEMAWVTSDNPNKLPLGSIFEHDVIPLLKTAGKID